MKVVPTFVGAVLAGIAGYVVSTQSWSFVWVMATMLALVALLGIAAILVAMMWEQHAPHAQR